MSGNNESLAKFARPRNRNVYRRTSLFDRLDEARHSPAIWISAPPGSGKTTLISSYLNEQNSSCIWYHVDETDEDIATFFWYMRLAVRSIAPKDYQQLPAYTSAYRGGLSAFSLRFFEKLYALLPPDFVVVIDDYHLAGGSEAFEKALAQAIAALPGFGNIFVIGRDPLPARFSRLLGNESLHLLGWEDLRLTQDEAQGIAAMRHPDMQADELDRITSTSAGWATGLIFGLQNMDLGVLANTMSRDNYHDALFGYFANEVFAQQDPADQSLIMRLSLLPRMTQAMACRLTGSQRAGALLNWLHRHNYFVNLLALKLPTYKFHPLFRGFLQDRLRQTCDSRELAQLRRQAALVMEEGGYEEAACKLYKANGDWDNAVRLILSGAPEKFRQGMLQSLAGKISRLPEDILGQNPWLLYWLGMCSMFLKPGTGHSHFSKAFEQFRAGHDSIGMMAAWAGATNALMTEWADIRKIDDWVQIAERELPDDPQRLYPAMGAHVTASMCFALFLCRPNSDRLARVVAKTDAVLIASDDLTFSLMGCNLMLIFYGWQGQIAKARLLLDSLRRKMKKQLSSDSHKVMWAAAEGWMELIAGEPQKCVNICTEALGLAEVSGVHLFDNKFFGMVAHANLLLGRPEASREYLNQYAEIVPEHANLVQFHIHFLHGWERWRSGDGGSAREHLHVAAGFLEAAGSPPIVAAKTQLALARLHFEAGEESAGRSCLASAQRITQISESSWLHYSCALLEAESELDAGRQAEAVNALRMALELAKKNNLVSTDWWNPEAMSRLMELALLKGIEPDYVRHIISKTELVPGPLSESSPAWPWPVSIRVLGDFRLLVNGEAAGGGVKGQKKVLELLKALAVFGPEGLSVYTLADYIWPDSDGDDARNALKTTVHRLRKLLGASETVEQRDGLLRLNPELCCADVDVFRVLAKTPRGSEERIRRLKKALELYAGVLLPADEMPWVITPRKKLQWLEHNIVMELGSRYEERCRWNKAIKVYRQGMRSDELDEQVCRHLMQCYQRTGRESDALAAYEIYRAQLEQAVARRPSARTRMLAETLLS